MPEPHPRSFVLLAGRGDYPRLLLQEARRHGVERIGVIGFRGETDPALLRAADWSRWIHLGQMGRLLDALRESGMSEAIMAGQLRPTNVFRVRPDAWSLKVLKSVGMKHAHSVFGMVVRELAAIGVTVLPASTFMERYMPGAGVLSRRAPDSREQADIDLGRRLGAALTALEIGQTVVIKDGIAIAAEALEGTDRTIRRAGRVAGPGTVVVKTARRNHDMRFDIPVIGLRTLRTLRRARASCLAFQEQRAILLDRDRLVAEADRIGLSLVGVPPWPADAPLVPQNPQPAETEQS